MKKTTQKKDTTIDNLEFELKRLIDVKDRYQNPTHFFNISQQVETTTYWKNCVIEQNYEDLFYLISYDSTKHNYGKPITTRNQAWIPWTDIFLTHGKTQFNKQQENFDIEMSFSNKTIGGLLHRYYISGIELNPVYQRGLVWTTSDKEKLIESIFDGVEIGKFSFVHLEFKSPTLPNYEILDGKQRLTTIIDFIENRFKYKGYFYSELSLEDKRYFENYLVAVGDSRGEMTELEKMRYFLKINVCGQPHSVNHINNIIELFNKELNKPKSCKR